MPRTFRASFLAAPRFLFGLAATTLSLAACGHPAPTGNDGGDITVGLDTRSDGTTEADAPLDTTTQPCTTDDDCADGVFCNGAERCMPAAPGANSRGCIAPSPATPCVSGEVCNETMMRCTANCTTPDSDGDGHRALACGGDDCDDNDANRFPGATEVCDTMNHDEDCDPHTYGVRDQDHDGYPDARCCNVDSDSMMNCGTDCEDTRADVHPDLPEACDPAMLDENCNGMRNEGCDCVDATSRPCQDTSGAAALGQCAMGTQACVSGHYAACSVQPTLEVCDGIDNDCNGMTDEGLTIVCYPDVDDDGYPPSTAAAMNACPAPGRGGVGGCPVHSTNRAPGAATSDCLDSNPSVFPGAPEACNGLDDDCNGMTDEGCSCVVGSTRFCGTGAGGAGLLGACGMGTQMCTSSGWSACPSPTPEVCNGIDDNCNGTIDEGAMVTCYVDADADGYAAAGAMSQTQCPIAGRPPLYGGCPIGFTANGSGTGLVDCDDSDVNRNPGAAEACNCVDDNCNGSVDEGVTISGYVDNDGDGYGSTAVTVCATRCGGQPAAVVATAGDCCDVPGDGTGVHPGASFSTSTRPASCGGGFDWNCDGVISQQSTTVGGGSCTTSSTGTCVRATGFRTGWAGTVPPCGTIGADTVLGCARQYDDACGCLVCQVAYSTADQGCR